MERDQYCGATVTLETCHAIRLKLSNGNDWIVWRDRTPKRLKAPGVKRWRDLKPGDVVVVDGRQRLVVAQVLIYR